MTPGPPAGHPQAPAPRNARLLARPPVARPPARVPRLDPVRLLDHEVDAHAVRVDRRSWALDPDPARAGRRPRDDRSAALGHRPEALRDRADPDVADADHHVGVVRADGAP